MQRFGTLAVVVVSALMSPTAASGYTFGEWARDHGYSPRDVMPYDVNARSSGIDSLDGIGEFDWTTTPTISLDLRNNELSNIESGDFAGLTNLESLWLPYNELSNIEPGAFSGLTNLKRLRLDYNQLSSIEPGDFDGLTNLTDLWLNYNQLSSIESGDFSGLTNLTSLGLSGNQLSSIESGDFSGLTNLTRLSLSYNQLSSIEPGDFDGLTNLTDLWLSYNQLSSIESGAFSGLTNLRTLDLDENIALTELNLEAADFSSLTSFGVEGNANITSVSLRNAVVNQTSLARLLDGGWRPYDIEQFPMTGIGELPGITDLDLSGIDFFVDAVVDANGTDVNRTVLNLAPLYVMDDLTDLWLVETVNLDAIDLDALLDNLATIERTDIEGILHLTRSDFAALNAAGGGLLSDWVVEPGHHVEFLQLGDVNHDSEVNGLDIDPFVRVLLAGRYDVAADTNEDGAVNGLDVDLFVATVIAGGGVQAVPEPSTPLLAALAMVGLLCWRCKGR